MPIEELKTYFQEQFLNNQYFTGLAGGLIVTSVLFFFRGIPRVLWGHAEKFLIHSVRINNDDQEVFKLVREWCAKNINTKKRKFFSRDGDLVNELSYGRHYRLSKYGILTVDFSEQELQNSINRKEAFDITFYHWSENIYKDFINYVLTGLNKSDIKIPYSYKNDSWGEWRKFRMVKDRSLDYLFIDKKVKGGLLEKMDSFYSEDTQKKHALFGMNYKYGILLYGPPGTGKTSLIKALAQKYKKNICYLNLATLDKDTQLEGIYEYLPKDSFLVIEDIDCFKVTHDRESGDDSKELLNISTVLTCLDGDEAPEGTVIIATTNHIERLDPAVIRDGRFDVKIELKEADEELAREMSVALTGKEHPVLKTLEYPVKQAKLQNILFDV